MQKPLYDYIHPGLRFRVQEGKPEPYMAFAAIDITLQYKVWYGWRNWITKHIDFRGNIPDAWACQIIIPCRTDGNSELWYNDKFDLKKKKDEMLAQYYRQNDAALSTKIFVDRLLNK